MHKLWKIESGHHVRLRPAPARAVRRARAPGMDVLTVMPLPVRPSIAIEGEAIRSEDDLTFKLRRYYQSVGQRAKM
ncbi:hypothetical protein C8J57DRAFT_1135165 [Mycena rebaudengoi]|nr:hypothetical protein C8J57DRAFT_1135165 [Mycena rebaudengoi]